jgi:hypothetical protein
MKVSSVSIVLKKLDESKNYFYDITESHTNNLFKNGQKEFINDNGEHIIISPFDNFNKYFINVSGSNTKYDIASLRKLIPDYEELLNDFKDIILKKEIKHFKNLITNSPYNKIFHKELP